MKTFIMLILFSLITAFHCSKNFDPIVTGDDNSSQPEIVKVSSPTKILADGSHPAWSPDDSWIAYTGWSETTRQDIYMISVTGDIVKQLTHEVTEENHPFWSPDGGTIGFGSNQGEKGLYKIFTLAMSSGEIAQITPDSFKVQAGDWSPDGGSIVFDSGAPQRSIAVIQLGDNQIHLLTPDSEYEGWPKYSPDGSRIVFEALKHSHSGSYNIWTINIDGSNLKQITTTGGEYPCWSPDGKWIAYSLLKSGNYDIYIIGAEGGDPIQITNSEANEVRACWSHSGKFIVYDTSMATKIGPIESGIWIVSIEFL